MPEYRFTLRREYFGGVLHDAREISCDVLSPPEYGFLKSLDAGVGSANNQVPAGDTPVLSGRLASWLSKGAIRRGSGDSFQLADTRILELPVIPDKCLAAPLRVYDTYTRRCNLDCPQCCLAGGPTFVEMRRTLAETRRIMDKFWEVGTMEWRFTGGEPTSCPDLLDAIAHAKSRGMAVMLNTNGCWSKQLMHDIPVSGVDELIISLEGREEINDRRRNRGTFRRVI
jgi:sulfatase maturation enzyme AslB (radical SAM superfamily)